MKNKEYIRAIENCSLNPKDFTHENHIRMAFIYLKQNDLPEALILIRNAIKNFAAHHGLPDLYNETITVWYALVINDRLSKSGDIDWLKFKACNQDLFKSSSVFIRDYYLEETVKSDKAKSTFVLPDVSVKEIVSGY